MDVHFFIIVSFDAYYNWIVNIFHLRIMLLVYFFHRKRFVQPSSLPSKAELENIQTVRCTTDHLYKEVQNISFEHSQEYIDDNVSVQARISK